MKQTVCPASPVAAAAAPPLTGTGARGRSPSVEVGDSQGLADEEDEVIQIVAMKAIEPLLVDSQHRRRGDRFLVLDRVEMTILDRPLEHLKVGGLVGARGRPAGHSSLIEPNLTAGHSDYHPACARALLAGGTGGTYDHVPPGPVPPPDPSAPAGQMGFEFDRSGYRVPAIVVSPWVDEGIVVNEEHRHTSMIATLRKVWGLGDAFTDRDAAAAPFDPLLSRESPRDPESWPDVEALPVPEFHMDLVQMGKALSTLGKTAGGGMLEHARQAGVEIPPELADPDAHPSAEQFLAALRSVAGQFFPRLA